MHPAVSSALRPGRRRRWSSSARFHAPGAPPTMAATGSLVIPD